MHKRQQAAAHDSPLPTAIPRPMLSGRSSRSLSKRYASGLPTFILNPKKITCAFACVWMACSMHFHPFLLNAQPRLPRGSKCSATGHRRASPATGWPVYPVPCRSTGLFPYCHASLSPRGENRAAFTASGRAGTRAGALGLSSDQLNAFRSALDQPQGLLLVTGPTGSGKTVTLYSALQTRNHDAVNICSVEDPLEMPIAGMNQTQINPAPG